MSNVRPRVSTVAETGVGLAAQDVRAQLDRILAHRDFEASERIRDFLRFVVEETLADRAHRLKGYTIAREVFGRAKNFDANLDPIVRIQAGRLRRALEHYYLEAGRRDPIRIDIPRGGYVPTFAPQPAVRTRASDSLPGTAEDLLQAGPTIAIMPFTDLTDDREQLFFVNGLVEELISEMNRYEDVICIPCQGVVTEGGTPQPRQLGPKLGARFMVTGNVRRDVSHMKVSAQLSDTTTGRQIWGDSYKVELEAASVIETQEEIARNVISAIAGEYGIIARRLVHESNSKPPAALSTYEALLRYHHYMLVMTPSAAERALAALEQATQREPVYGPAWSGLANLFAHAYIFERPHGGSPLERATEYARKGLALEPRSQLAHTIMAYVYLLRDELDLFHHEADSALALNPHSPNYVGTIGYMLVNAGEFERGAALLEQAIAWNPCHPKWFHHGLCAFHFQRGDYENAYKEVLKVGFQVGFWDAAIKAAALGKLGRTSEAEESARELLAVIPDFERRARHIVSRTVKSAALVEDFLDGLGRAGLHIER